MPETAYVPDPTGGAQQQGNRHLPEGFPFDDLVARRTRVQLALVVSSAVLLSAANERKVGVMIRNNSAAPLIIGPDSSVGTSSATGFPAIGASASGGHGVFLRTTAAIWVNSSGVNADIVEYFRT